MIDNLYFIVLILNITGLFRFIAPYVHVSIQTISLFLLAINFVYLVCRISCLRKVFFKLGPWFFMLVVWPVITVPYAPAIVIREIGLWVYGFTLLTGAAVYTASNGLFAIYRVFLVGFVLTVFGQVLNMIAPAYFEAAAILADARVISMGRPGGFYLQPNSLGTGLAFIFICCLAVMAKHGKSFWEPFIILVFLLGELLTGSRAGMVVGLVIVALHLGAQWQNMMHRSLSIRRFAIRLVILLACIWLSAFGMKAVLSSFVNQVEYQHGNLVNRMSMLLEFKLSNDSTVIEDSSVVSRLGAQKDYWRLIKEKPLLGHGLGAESTYLSRGMVIDLSSHSMLYSTAMEFGVLYPMIFLLLLLRFVFNPYRKTVEHVFGTNTFIQFLMMTALMFVFGGSLFDRRVFFVLFGVLYITASYPWKLFVWNRSTRTCGRMLSKSEIHTACYRRQHKKLFDKSARKKTLQ